MRLVGAVIRFAIGGCQIVFGGRLESTVLLQQEVRNSSFNRFSLDNMMVRFAPLGEVVASADSLLPSSIQVFRLFIILVALLFFATAP